MKFLCTGLGPALLMVVAASLSFGQDDGFYLHAGDRVVFYGDSITDQRLYTTFAETFVVTRFPKMPVAFVHSGWGGDRVSGGSGGAVDLRIARDVVPYRPTVMTLMLGMNDGGYRAYDLKLFEAFSEGYQHIVKKVTDEIPGIRLTLIQPSPYDDYTRPPTFEGGYNQTLDQYSRFVQRLADHDRYVDANLNSPVVQALVRAKSADPELAKKLIPDRVHPGAAGHMIMAQALLKAWHAPSMVSAVEIEGAKLVAATNTAVTNLTKQDTLTWVQQDRCLPFPIDWNDKEKLVPLAVAASGLLEALDSEMLTVRGLAEGRYALRIDGAEAGQFTATELAGGINLAKLAGTPMMKQAMSVHALTLKRTGIHQFRWRNIQVPMAAEDLPHKEEAMAALDKLDDDLLHEQRAMAQPVARRYELAPVADR